MARINQVVLMGTVTNNEFEPRLIEENGERNMVLNLKLQYWNNSDKRYYNLPIAVWGSDMVKQCIAHLKKGHLIYVYGELRYKFIRDPNTSEIKRIYTTVKAASLEFFTKKAGDETFFHQINEVRLAGNLVEDPVETEDGFILAVDRLYPTKDIKTPNHKLTDYITICCDDKNKIRGNLRKGSMAIIDGELMTKKRVEGVVQPRVVVRVKEMVGR